ncbi:hypothetical protein [Myxococcus faecalis]|uniref:hypothetical protein n=1 Tax=Myxococcus faecalis TaxID=3115646 RepID=UPI003CF19CFE
MLAPPGSSVFLPHPKALGYSKRAGSPFVTEVSGRLVITRVLTELGEADIHNLPRQPGRGRPRVYCPFCGVQGKYRVPQVDPGAFTAHFAHDDGNCVLRTIPITFSGASRTPSPGQAEHRFRSKPNTCSRLKQWGWSRAEDLAG